MPRALFEQAVDLDRPGRHPTDLAIRPDSHIFINPLRSIIAIIILILFLG